MDNLEVLKREVETKKKVLEEFADLALGLVAKSEFDVIQQQLTEMEEKIRGEQGRVTITQAECDAVETRLRELEEVDRELEASALEASKEIEMLRAQEKDIEERNAELKEQLDSAFVALNELLSQLESSHYAAEQLSTAKTELTDTQVKIQWYNEQITTINQKYIDLKHAYDALDIEYAQLYEKHNAALLAQEQEQEEGGG